jgi:hypothetical protein
MEDPSTMRKEEDDEAMRLFLMNGIRDGDNEGIGYGAMTLLYTICS